MFAPTCYLWSVSNISPLSGPNRFSEIISNMLAEAEASRRGRPGLWLAMPLLIALAQAPPGDRQSVRPSRRANPGRNGHPKPPAARGAHPPSGRRRRRNPLPQVPGQAPEWAPRSITFRGRVGRPPTTCRTSPRCRKPPGSPGRAYSGPAVRRREPAPEHPRRPAPGSAPPPSAHGLTASHRRHCHFEKSLIGEAGSPSISLRYNNESALLLPVLAKRRSPPAPPSRPTSRRSCSRNRDRAAQARMGDKCAE